MAKKGERIKWKTVKVPSEVHKVLKAKAKESGQAMHKVITSAILVLDNKDLAEAAQKLPAGAKNVDKAIWYCLKLVNGIAMYKQALKISTMIDAAEDSHRERN